MCGHMYVNPQTYSERERDGKNMPQLCYYVKVTKLPPFWPFPSLPIWGDDQNLRVYISWLVQHTVLKFMHVAGKRSGLLTFMVL